MKKGIIINQREAQCSIYESGTMVRDVLGTGSSEYTLDYLETDRNLGGYEWNTYDFNIINWHPLTLPIDISLLNKMGERNIAIVEEVSPLQNLPYTKEWFSAYMLLDPTKAREGKFFPFPRPLIFYPTRPLLDENKLVLGGFGLYNLNYSTEKRFEDIIVNANTSGRECIVRINLPLGTFTETPLSKIVAYGNWLKSFAKSNVEVVITHDYMSKEELVGWLSEHTLNCFPYYRDRPGLGAVADQAIVAGRGIMTTECNTFRHLHKYISYYPKESYLSLSQSTLVGIKQMQMDWSPENFRKDFDNMLKELEII